MEYSDFGATRNEGVTGSGIRVVTYTIPRRPITMHAAFNAGRRYDPTSPERLAHVTEHMIVAGTANLPSKDRLTAYIERLGGSISASTFLSPLLLKMKIGNVSDFGSADTFSTKCWPILASMLMFSTGSLMRSVKNWQHAGLTLICMQNVSLGSAWAQMVVATGNCYSRS